MVPSYPQGHPLLGGKCTQAEYQTCYVHLASPDLWLERPARCDSPVPRRPTFGLHRDTRANHVNALITGMPPCQSIISCERSNRELRAAQVLPQSSGVQLYSVQGDCREPTADHCRAQHSTHNTPPLVLASPRHLVTPSPRHPVTPVTMPAVSAALNPRQQPPAGPSQQSGGPSPSPTPSPSSSSNTLTKPLLTSSWAPQIPTVGNVGKPFQSFPVAAVAVAIIFGGLFAIYAGWRILKWSRMHKILKIEQEQARRESNPFVAPLIFTSGMPGALEKRGFDPDAKPPSIFNTSSDVATQRRNQMYGLFDAPASATQLQPLNPAGAAAAWDNENEQLSLSSGHSPARPTERSLRNMPSAGSLGAPRRMFHGDNAIANTITPRASSTNLSATPRTAPHLGKHKMDISLPSPLSAGVSPHDAVVPSSRAGLAFADKAGIGNNDFANNHEQWFKK